jgi:hypothetical protein
METFTRIVRSVPPLGWAVITVLVLVFVYSWWRASQQAGAIRNAVAAWRAALEATGPTSAEERRLGRSLASIDRLRERASSLDELAAGWWRHVDDAIAPYRSARRDDGYFLTALPGELLTEDRVVGAAYDGRMQASVPGLLTSIGLLGTFATILVGLSGLSPDPKTETVKGVSLLVSSLSGKFATSVVALGLSALYVALIEHRILRSVRAARRALVAALADAIPTLSVSHVLLDMRSESLKQSESLGNISSDMATAFADKFERDLAPVMAQQLAGSVGAELGPALQTLTATMDRVGSAVAALERDKQESVTGELRGLVTSMETTLKSSLEAMGNEFRSALTGSARDEFTNVARALEGSAGVLQSMNDGFSTMQATLQSLIDESRRTTELQMAAGGARAEALNRLVESLLVRLNESASQNATHVQGVLAQVVSDLSGRVTALSDELVAKVGEATAASQAAAADTVRRAGETSIRTTEEVASIVAELRQRVQEFDRAATTLRDAQGFVQRTLEQNGAGLRAMQDAASKVEMLSATLAGAASAVSKTQEAQLRTAETARGQLAHLESMAQQHGELLRQYDGALRHAHDLFAQLDDKLGATLDTILDKVQQYNRGVEQNFQSIMEHVNGTMPTMGNLLHTATDELREQVEELTDVIAELRGARRAPAGAR